MKISLEGSVEQVFQNVLGNLTRFNLVSAANHAAAHGRLSFQTYGRSQIFTKRSSHPGPHCFDVRAEEGVQHERDFTGGRIESVFCASLTVALNLVLQSLKVLAN